MSLRTHQTPSGSVTVARIAPGVVFSAGTGKFSEKLLSPLLEACERSLRETPRLSLFVDWLDLAGYTPLSRADLTQWLLDHRAQVACVHVLVRVDIVRMAVSTTALSLGGGLVQSYLVRPDFDRQLRLACVVGATDGARPREGETGPTPR